MKVVVMGEQMLPYLLREASLKLPLPFRLALLAAESGGTFTGGIDGMRERLGPYSGIAPWHESSLNKGVRLGIEHGFLTADSTASRFTARPEVVQLVEIEHRAVS